MLVVGAGENERCGIADYTFNLAKALSEEGAEVEVFVERDWRLRPSLLNRLLGVSRRQIIHVQYPSIGYQKSVIPHLASALWSASSRVAVTLHEFTQARRMYQRASGMFRRAQAVVFTNSFERDAYQKRFGVGHLDTIIPLGSNIPFLVGDKKDRSTVVYFGLFRPHKGLEEFIELARLSKLAGMNNRFVAVGTAGHFDQEYSARLRSSGQGLDVNWLEDLPSHAVGELLGGYSISYLPLPDGASERRTSLIALLGNGVAVLSKWGEQTTEELKKVTMEASSPRRAMEILRNLQDNPAKLDDAVRASAAYAERHVWTNVATAHIQLYEKLLQVPHGKVGS